MENRNISIRHSLGWSIQISKQKQIYQKLIHYSKISTLQSIISSKRQLQDAAKHLFNDQESKINWSHHLNS